MPDLPKTVTLPDDGRQTESMMREPVFSIGDVPIYGDVMLSPMAGFADVPTRAICRSFGSALSYTEFVAVEEILNGTRRALALLDYEESDRPMVFQIFGNDPNKILRAAQRIEALGPDVIDINMGCSTRRVSGRGAGVGMMLNPGLIAETFHLLTQHLQVPVSGKIRLGWDANQNYLEVARILEDNGAAMIAIHPRTKEQRYRGKAKWEAIAEVCEAVNIPVVGNGDVTRPADIDAMLRQTGCQAVMIGRGAIGNPWLFARVDKQQLSLSEALAITTRHLDLMLEYHGERGLILFRKHVKRYLAGLRPLKPLLRNMVTAPTVAMFKEVLAAAENQLGSHTLEILSR